VGHRKFYNHRGFGSIELILVLVIVGLLGFVAWYVVNSKSQTQNNLNNASVISSDQVTKVPSFTFKEYAVKIPLPAELKGLDYQSKTITNSDDSKTVDLFLTTEDLHKAINACNGNFDTAVSDASFAALYKGSGKFQADQPSPDVGKLLKQFDKFYVSVNYPNGLPCVTDESKNESILKDMKALQTALTEAFKNASLVQ
jgi:type II secretory pathway pseudopilin PulG